MQGGLPGLSLEPSKGSRLQTDGAGAYPACVPASCLIPRPVKIWEKPAAAGRLWDGMGVDGTRFWGPHIYSASKICPLFSIAGATQCSSLPSTHQPHALLNQGFGR